jgi:hypothetical protein
MQIAWYGKAASCSSLWKSRLERDFLGFIGVDLCSLCNGEGSASGAGAIGGYFEGSSFFLVPVTWKHPALSRCHQVTASIPTPTVTLQQHTNKHRFSFS